MFRLNFVFRDSELFNDMFRDFFSFSFPLIMANHLTNFFKKKITEIDKIRKMEMQKKFDLKLKIKQPLIEEKKLCKTYRKNKRVVWIPGAW